MGTLKPSLPSGISGGQAAAARATRVRDLVVTAGGSMALLAYVHRLGFAIFEQGQAGWIFFVFGDLWLAGAFCWLLIDVTKPLASTA